MAGNQVKVELLGTSFTIKTSEDPDYFAGLMDYLKRTVDTVQKSTGVVDPLKASILANLFIVDELFAERKRRGDLFEHVPQVELTEAEKIAERLIKTIDERLE